MQGITIYGPSTAEIQPEQLGGENHWFRAGRVAIVPKPEPGLWTIRLQGAGPFFLAVQGHARLGLHAVKFASGLPHQGQEDLLTLALNATGPNVRFSLVNAAGEILQPLVLQNSEGQPGIFSGSVIPGFRQFRVLAEGTDESGYAFQRMDPRLMEASPGVR